MTDETTKTQGQPNRSTEPGHKDHVSGEATETQPSPNLSTEHQKDGDARSPSDTLDRGQ